MPDAPDLVLCSQLCRHNPTRQTLVNDLFYFHFMIQYMKQSSVIMTRGIS